MNKTQTTIWGIVTLLVFLLTRNPFTLIYMMFMEMAAYVGDVMSFYLDNQIQETYLQYARQTDNLTRLPVGGRHVQHSRSGWAAQSLDQ